MTKTTEQISGIAALHDALCQASPDINEIALPIIQPRRVRQIAAVSGNYGRDIAVVALCEDDTLWAIYNPDRVGDPAYTSGEGRWQRLPPIPASEDGAP